MCYPDGKHAGMGLAALRRSGELSCTCSSNVCSGTERSQPPRARVAFRCCRRRRSKTQHASTWSRSWPTTATGGARPIFAQAANNHPQKTLHRSRQVGAHWVRCAMPQSDSPEQDDPRKMRQSYAQLGLELGSTMREIENAYWRFARELKGQAAMAPYNEAYEALVKRVRPRANDEGQAPAAPQEAAEPPATPVAPHPPSKFGWPAP